jgi:protein-export membrane protein SecD
VKVSKGLIIALGVISAVVLVSLAAYLGRDLLVPDHGIEMTLQVPPAQTMDTPIDGSARIKRIAAALERRGRACGTKAVIVNASTVRVRYPGATGTKSTCFVDTGDLAFYLVDESYDANKPHNFVPKSRLRLPSDDRTAPYVVLMPQRLMSGDQIASAQAVTDAQSGAPGVSFHLTSDGSAHFLDITQHNAGKRFAIVIDGRVISAPRILGPIPGGNGLISGSFTRQGAETFAALLRSGALPVGLQVTSSKLYNPGEAKP